MEQALQEIIAWVYPLVSVVLLVIATTRRSIPGRPWLIAHLATELVTMLAWRVPMLLSRFESLEFDRSRFYHFFSLPLNVLGLAGFCLLIPFLLAVAASRHPLPDEDDERRAWGDQGAMPVRGDTTHPLYGVHGWLKFFVVMTMYVAPVVFILNQILAFVGFFLLADEYPGLVVVGLVEAGVGAFLVIKWVMIARRLRDLQPGVVREVKQWLLISVAWTVLSVPLTFLSGVDAEEILPGIIRSLLAGLISFTIWYSYFTVSKRVKATYPDWNR